MKKMNKKPLIAIALIALIGIIGGTFAIFSRTVEIPNFFKTGVFKNTITETFTSPNDWTPGTTTPKTIAVTNDGNIPIVVRAHYIEKWTSQNGNDLQLTKDGKPLVTINLDNQESWTEKEESNIKYYYYNYILGPGDSIDSFIESVTFNEDIDLKQENGTQVVLLNGVSNDRRKAKRTKT